MNLDATILTERNASKLRASIQEIVAQGAKASKDLCWALYETYTTQVRIGGVSVPIYQAWGYDSWSRFVGIELGLHVVTAYCYRRVWEVFFVKLDGAWDHANLLPISKMRILCAAKLDKRNVNSWLKKAKALTCAQLVAEVYGTAELHTLAVNLKGKDYEALKAVLADAQSAFGPELPRGEVLLKMASEWHAMYKNTAKTRSKLKLVG